MFWQERCDRIVTKGRIAQEKRDASYVLAEKSSLEVNKYLIEQEKRDTSYV